MRDVEAKKDIAQGRSPKRPRRVAGEKVPLGRTIYEQDIRHRVEKGNVGKICAIDVDSGCWAVGETASEAARLLREQTPEAIDVWLERVGFWGLRSFGAGSFRRRD